MDFDIQLLDPDAGAACDAGSFAAGRTFGAGRKIKDTGSICPVCLEKVEAAVYERSGEVWMDKHCKKHGRYSALLSSDVRHYHEPLARPSSSGCCTTGCGVATAPSPAADGEAAPWVNHSCTILIEITERCNLSCPTCFAGSSPTHTRQMSLDEFTRQVDRLADGGKRGADMIQLSGGEPTIHPDFLAIIEALFERGFHQVCINSNGIKLAQPAFVERLAACRNRHPGSALFIYLQFDGFDDATHDALRGRSDLLSQKRKALRNCGDAGISVHPVMTLTRGVNDHEVGDFVRLAVDCPDLKNVVLQPAMYSGRYDNPRRGDRITLADTVDLVCNQFGVFEPEDFMPIPCSDPNCFGMAVALRTPRGLLPVSRLFPRYETWNEEDAQALIDEFSDTINGPRAISSAVRWATEGGRIGRLLEQLAEDDVDALLDALLDARSNGGSLWDKALTISIKPFMDAWSYDQDRIDACCVHILDPDGNPVSFCEYNAVTRPRMGAA
jgi:uncharacterized radical SAM superfamily Fe-S cluster-containing enzyme